MSRPPEATRTVCHRPRPGPNRAPTPVSDTPTDRRGLRSGAGRVLRRLVHDAQDRSSAAPPIQPHGTRSIRTVRPGHDDLASVRPRLLRPADGRAVSRGVLRGAARRAARVPDHPARLPDGHAGHRCRDAAGPTVPTKHTEQVPGGRRLAGRGVDGRVHRLRTVVLAVGHRPSRAGPCWCRRRTTPTTTARRWISRCSRSTSDCPSRWPDSC